MHDPTATIYRTTVADVTADGRTLSGIAVRLEHPSTVRDADGAPYREAFHRAAWNKSIRDRGKGRWPLGLLHPWAPGARTSPVPLGGTLFRVDGLALAFEARVSETVAGDEVLALLADGGLEDVSIGFRSLGQRDARDGAGPYVLRTEAALLELSLAPPGMGQHADAKVLAIRSGHPTVADGTPLLDELRRRRARLGVL